MPILMSIMMVASMLIFTACSKDKREQARLRVAELVEIDHNAGECPRTDGLYNRKEGFTAGIMGFDIEQTTEGTRMLLINSATGPDGELLIIDGRVHEGEDANRPVRYVGGCKGGVLTLRGSIGSERIDMEVSEKDGGEAVVKTGDQTIEYEKSLPEAEDLGERINDLIDRAQGQDPEQTEQAE